MGSAGRIERVYFEIKQSHIDQWEKPQIKVGILALSLVAIGLYLLFFLESSLSPCWNWALSLGIMGLYFSTYFILALSWAFSV